MSVAPRQVRAAWWRLIARPAPWQAEAKARSSLAALIPPARKHLVRYYGALGPRSPLRRAVSMAARAKATAAELEAGYSVTLVGESVRAAREAGSAAVRTWAACLRKVFEVYPVLCVKCGGEMGLAGVILDDGELDRIWRIKAGREIGSHKRAARTTPGRGIVKHGRGKDGGVD